MWNFPIYMAKLFGTFWLVFGGLRDGRPRGDFPGDGLGLVRVSLAFGLTELTMA